MDSVRERYGFFVLISNEVKDPVTALRLYRMRDVIEKAFWNIKERLNLRRTLRSDGNLNSSDHIRGGGHFLDSHPQLLFILKRTESSEC